MADESARIEQAKELIRGGDHGAARAVLRRALRAAPDDPAIHNLLCFICCEAGEIDDAIAHGRRAVAGAPLDPEANVNLGMSLLGATLNDEAVERFRAAVGSAPDHAPARYALCMALGLCRRYHEAIAESRAALDRFPSNPGFAARHANALAQTGRSREAIAILREAIRRNPDDATLATDLCAISTYAGAVSAREAFEAHRSYGALLSRIVPPLPGGPARTDAANPNRRLRIGFVSPDLRFHPVSVFLEPLLRHIRRDSFETILYATGGKEDEVTRRLRAACTELRRLPNIKTTELAAMIRRDRIDILFDLSGHTSGHALPTFQMRPAPVQATWLGFPSTTGLATMDYRVTDSIADPPGETSDPFATERLWRLDPSFLCYAPPSESNPLPVPAPGAPRWAPPDVGPPPCESPGPDGGAGVFTFGSFNSINKLDDAVIALWSRVLHEVPGSRLLLKHTALTAEDGRAIVCERFAPHLARWGVEPSRLTLEGPQKFVEFLDAYNRVDVCLDPFPFGGATTTCDALYMGAPVVTLRGDRTPGRVCASILTCVGLPELIATSEDEYVAIARSLGAPDGASRARLRDLRAGMRSRVLASPLCDAPAFARRFEAMLRAWWATHCAAGAR